MKVHRLEVLVFYQTSIVVGETVTVEKLDEDSSWSIDASRERERRKILRDPAPVVTRMLQYGPPLALATEDSDDLESNYERPEFAVIPITS